MKELGRDGVMERVRLHLGKKPDLVLFRNQAGKVEVDGRWMKYGLCDGASDLIGCLRIAPRNNTNTRDLGFREAMEVGRFFALECKASGEMPSQKVISSLISDVAGKVVLTVGRLRLYQQWQFIELINRFGGHAAFVDSVEGAEIEYLKAGGRHAGDPG